MDNITENNQSIEFKFHPRMDTYKAQEIENELITRIKNTSKDVVFDLDGVMYISSYFLRLCLNAAKSVGADKFSIINVRQDIRKVFEVSGFDKQLNLS